jgi:hypothetical protein
MDRKLIDALTHQRIDLDSVDVALPLTRGEIFQVADLREEPATPLNQSFWLPATGHCWRHP